MDSMDYQPQTPMAEDSLDLSENEWDLVQQRVDDSSDKFKEEVSDICEFFDSLPAEFRVEDAAPVGTAVGTNTAVGNAMECAPDLSRFNLTAAIDSNIDDPEVELPTEPIPTQRKVLAHSSPAVRAAQQHLSTRSVYDNATSHVEGQHTSIMVRPPTNKRRGRPQQPLDTPNSHRYNPVPEPIKKTGKYQHRRLNNREAVRKNRQKKKEEEQQTLARLSILEGDVYRLRGDKAVLKLERDALAAKAQACTCEGLTMKELEKDLQLSVIKDLQTRLAACETENHHLRRLCALHGVKVL